MIQITDAWEMAYPNAHLGVLAMRNVINPPHHAGLETQKAALEAQLRERFAGQEKAALIQHPVLQAYEAYYKRFKKTYHVQLQLESILFKGKSIPSVAALVEAMFMAEVGNLLLTAGHDLDALQLPLTLDVTPGDESYALLRGVDQASKAGDMLIRDGAGIISSVLYGPDARTQITAQTKNVIFTVYAPAGIDESVTGQHLRDIQKNGLLVAPRAQTELLEVFGG